MINKIVVVSSPFAKLVEPIKVDNVCIIKVPKEAHCLLANVDGEEVVAYEDGCITGGVNKDDK